MDTQHKDSDRPLFTWFNQAGLGSGHEDRAERIMLAAGLYQQQDRRRQGQIEATDQMLEEATLRVS